MISSAGAAEPGAAEPAVKIMFGNFFCSRACTRATWPALTPDIVTGTLSRVNPLCAAAAVTSPVRAIRAAVALLTATFCLERAESGRRVEQLLHLRGRA